MRDKEWCRALLVCSGVVSVGLACPACHRAQPPANPTSANLDTKGLAEAEQESELGPVIGEATATSAVVWLRQPGRPTSSIDVYRGSLRVTRAHAHSSAERDWTAAVVINGLEPATRYRVVVAETRAEAEFVSAPLPSSAEPVKFVFSGDLGGQNACRDAERGYPIFEVIAKQEPQFFLALGDMIYADDVCEAKGVYGNQQQPGGFGKAETVSDFWAHWRYNRAAPAHQALLRKVPMLAVWDDHEIANDFGPALPKFSTGLQAFVDYNPMPRDRSALYRSIRWGKHVELFLLDTRSYRDGNHALDGNVKPKSLLGAAQRDWLMREVPASDATWKFVVSSVPLAIPTGELHSRDGWSDPDNKTGFEHELATILRHFAKSHVQNLLFITTDVHFATGFVHKPKTRAGVLEIVELVVGPLSAGLFPTKAFDRDLNSERMFFYGPESSQSVRTFDDALAWFNFGAIEVSPSGTLTFKVITGKGAVVFKTTREPGLAKATKVPATR